MARKRDLGSLWHATGGAVLGLLLTALGLPAGISAWLVFMGGLTRELYQHRDDRPRMNAHRWLEAAAWGVGALAGFAL